MRFDFRKRWSWIPSIPEKDYAKIVVHTSVSEFLHHYINLCLTSNECKPVLINRFEATNCSFVHPRMCCLIQLKKQWTISTNLIWAAKIKNEWPTSKPRLAANLEPSSRLQRMSVSPQVIEFFLFVLPFRKSLKVSWREWLTDFFKSSRCAVCAVNLAHFTGTW